MITIKQLCKAAYENSKAHGFWEEHRNKGEMIALMHSELSECLEGVRGDKFDTHIPDFSMESAELADVCIRVFDYCEGFGIDLEQAILAKMAYNRQREHKHGKKF